MHWSVTPQVLHLEEDFFLHDAWDLNPAWQGAVSQLMAALRHNPELVVHIPACSPDNPSAAEINQKRIATVKKLLTDRLEEDLLQAKKNGGKLDPPERDADALDPTANDVTSEAAQPPANDGSIFTASIWSMCLLLILNLEITFPLPIPVPCSSWPASRR